MLRGNLHSKYFNHHSENWNDTDYSSTPHAAGIELKNCISSMTEVIFRCLLQEKMLGCLRKTEGAVITPRNTWE